MNNVSKDVANMNKRGQNIIEYILVITVVLVLLLIALNPKTGFMKDAVNGIFDAAVDGIETISTSEEFKFRK